MALGVLEAAIQRKITKEFISADPTSIMLRSNPMQIINGVQKVMPGALKLPQTFKISWSGDTGVYREVSGESPGSRRFDFILIGEHDANVSIGDFWEVGEQKFVIEYIFPPNGWEVKAGGICYGSPST